jgi:hypothetical protein
MTELCYIKNCFFSVLVTCCVFSTIVGMVQKKVMYRQDPYHIFSQPPKLRWLAMEIIFIHKKFEAWLQENFTEDVCFENLRPAIILAAQINRNGSYFGNGALNEKYYDLINGQLAKFNNEQERTAFYKRAVMFEHYYNMCTPGCTIGIGSYTGRLKEGFADAGYHFLYLLKMDVDEKRKEIIKAYSNDDQSKINELVESLTRNQILMLSMNFNDGSLSGKTLSSNRELVLEQGNISLAIVEAIQKHHPEILSDTDFFSCYVPLLEACLNENCLDVANKLIKKMFETSSYADVIIPGSGTWFHSVCGELNKLRKHGQEMSRYVDAVREITATFLDEMKKIYSKKELAAILNYKNQDKRTVLDCAVFNLFVPCDGTYRYKTQGIVTQFLDAGAYSYYALRELYHLSRGRSYSIWGQESFERIQQNYIDDGQGELLKENLDLFDLDFDLDLNLEPGISRSFDFAQLRDGTD